MAQAGGAALGSVGPSGVAFLSNRVLPPLRLAIDDSESLGQKKQSK
jgi:hypothetical protein